MDNIAFNIEFPMAHLMAITYGQLIIFEDELKDAIEQLEEFKKESVLSGMDEKAVEYQRHIHIASSNKIAIGNAIKQKEEDAKDGELGFFKN